MNGSGSFSFGSVQVYQVVVNGTRLAQVHI